MISIKKYIERNSEKRFEATLASYRAALIAMGESGVQACPPVGLGLRQSLLSLQAALSAESTSQGFQETGQKVESELCKWDSGAANYFKKRADEVKELMVILAHTAELTGERDQRYTRRFQAFTERLEAIADLHDLALIRDSLVKGATDLQACAEAMAEESRESVARLRDEVTAYQTRLDDAERLSGQDPLTGLDNRRRVESSIRRLHSPRGEHQPEGNRERRHRSRGVAGGRLLAGAAGGCRRRHVPRESCRVNRSF